MRSHHTFQNALDTFDWGTATDSSSTLYDPIVAENMVKSVYITMIGWSAGALIQPFVDQLMSGALTQLELAAAITSAPTYLEYAQRAAHVDTTLTSYYEQKWGEHPDSRFSEWVDDVLRGDRTLDELSYILECDEKTAEHTSLIENCYLEISNTYDGYNGLSQSIEVKGGYSEWLGYTNVSSGLSEWSNGAAYPNGQPILDLVAYSGCAVRYRQSNDDANWDEWEGGNDFPSEYGVGEFPVDPAFLAHDASGAIVNDQRYAFVPASLAALQQAADQAQTGGTFLGSLLTGIFSVVGSAVKSIGMDVASLQDVGPINQKAVDIAVRNAVAGASIDPEISTVVIVGVRPTLNFSGSYQTSVTKAWDVNGTPAYDANGNPMRVVTVAVQVPAGDSAATGRFTALTAEVSEYLALPAISENSTVSAMLKTAKDNNLKGIQTNAASASLVAAMRLQLEKTADGKAELATLDVSTTPIIYVSDPSMRSGAMTILNAERTATAAIAININPNAGARSSALFENTDGNFRVGSRDTVATTIHETGHALDWLAHTTTTEQRAMDFENTLYNIPEKNTKRVSYYPVPAAYGTNKALSASDGEYLKGRGR